MKEDEVKAFRATVWSAIAADIAAHPELAYATIAEQHGVAAITVARVARAYKLVRRGKKEKNNGR